MSSVVVSHCHPGKRNVLIAKKKKKDQVNCRRKMESHQKQVRKKKGQKPPM